MRLFHRTNRRVRLTEEGLLYLDACTRVLADLEETDALFAGPGDNPRGIIRFASAKSAKPSSARTSTNSI